MAGCDGEGDARRVLTVAGFSTREGILGGSLLVGCVKQHESARLNSYHDGSENDTSISCFRDRKSSSVTVTRSRIGISRMLPDFRHCLTNFLSS